jgi:Protein of unknown function (DUF4238)
MSDAKRHHYVGQFLLEGWCGADGKLCVYTRKGGRLACDRHTPKHTAYEMNLYTIEAFPEAERQVVEKEVMNKMVDEPASKILKRLLAGEVGQLNRQDRTGWVRFMFAQWLRSPDGIAEVRRLGAEILRKNVDANPEEYLAVRGDAPEKTASEWLEARLPGYKEILPMARMLPMAIDNEIAGQVIINMLWDVIDLHAASVDLLTSDQPVIRFQGIGSPDACIMIPLDPHRLFIASHRDLGFRRYEATMLAMAANESTVRAAKACVYGTGPQHREVVEKFLAGGAFKMRPAKRRRAHRPQR